VLQREITNIKTPVMIIENLEAGTKYSITVSAIYENRDGLLLESVESDALEFDTSNPNSIFTQFYLNYYSIEGDDL